MHKTTAFIFIAMLLAFGASAAEAWSTYHGGPTLTGVANVAFPDTLNLRWRYVNDDKIYNPPVTDGERCLVATYHGKLIALDYAGKEIWTKQLYEGEEPGGQPRRAILDAPSACFNDTFFVGTSRGIIHAFDSKTGEQRWTADIGGTLLGTINHGNLPAGEDGKERSVLYVICQDDGALSCIDAEDGTILWTAEGPERCDGSPSVGEGAVVFGSCAAALHVLNAADGKVENTIPIDDDSQVAAGVAITGGSVFAGSRSGKVLQANLKSGKTLWVNQDTTSEVFSTPAVTGMQVVFGAEDGGVYSLSRATGKLQWKFETEGAPKSPVISGDKVLCSANGTLYMLALKDGRLLWSREIGDETSNPAVIGDMIMVCGEDGSITAFGA